MVRFLIAIVTVVSTILATPSANAQAITCSNFDSIIWAQTIFEATGLPALDTDGDGLACEEIGITGFAPATWTNQVPADLIEAQIVGVTDGDTFDVMIDGQPDVVRIYRADTPEKYFEQQCGGDEATAFSTWALSFNDLGATVYLEQDASIRDDTGRLLAYVWFLIDGQPYMLNELLIRAGIAADVDYGDHKYDRELMSAAAFAEKYQLGMWTLCGGFGIPLSTASANASESTGASSVPITGAIVTDGNNEALGIGGNGCDPSYPDFCIPPRSQVGDLNCGDIAGTWFTVLPPDLHRLDRDNDGWGCER